VFKRDFNLWVSLPKNDAKLAKAAVEAGADALKVHSSVEHFASGTRFGSLAEEKENIAAIIEAAQGIPVGIVPGGSVEAAPETLFELSKLGLAFAFIYANHCPARWLSELSLPLGLAPNHEFPRELVPFLAREGVFAIEASVMPHTRYGQPPTAADLALYRFFRAQTDLPIVVPSQLKWSPVDMRALKATGVDAFMIGAVVTGSSAASIFEATAAFKKAIASL